MKSNDLLTTDRHTRHPYGAELLQTNTRFQLGAFRGSSLRTIHLFLPSAADKRAQITYFLASDCRNHLLRDHILRAKFLFRQSFFLQRDFFRYTTFESELKKNSPVKGISTPVIIWPLNSSRFISEKRGEQEGFWYFAMTSPNLEEVVEDTLPRCEELVFISASTYNLHVLSIF